MTRAAYVFGVVWLTVQMTITVLVMEYIDWQVPLWLRIPYYAALAVVGWFAYVWAVTRKEPGDDEEDDESPLCDHCWCGEPSAEIASGVLGREWCHAHAPRCRSGAHFHGDCRCVGDDELARRRAKEKA